MYVPLRIEPIDFYEDDSPAAINLPHCRPIRPCDLRLTEYVCNDAVTNDHNALYKLLYKTLIEKVILLWYIIGQEERTTPSLYINIETIRTRYIDRIPSPQRYER